MTQKDRPLVPNEDFLNTIVVWVDPRDVNQFVELSRLSCGGHSPLDTMPNPIANTSESSRLDRVA